ncbi:hypothetical protein GGP85_003023 [Salinibacter ruber]|nr:hypothetical protein [Salinibacter ruber]
MATKEVPSNPTREGEHFCLRPGQELVFAPAGPEESTAESPPLRADRRRTIVRVRPDTATRYGRIYKLLTAAERMPNAVGEDLGGLMWALLYGSIRAAKRAERVLQEARHLVAN